MSGPCATLEILLELGFEDRPPVIQISPTLCWMVPEHIRSPLVSVCYRFDNFDLVASPLTKTFGQDVVQLSGVLEAPRSLTEIQGEIPPDLGRALEAAAWVSFALKFHERDLRPLPDWFVEGKHHWDLVYARMDPEGWERQRAYRDCPKCFLGTYLLLSVDTKTLLIDTNLYPSYYFCGILWPAESAFSASFRLAGTLFRPRGSAGGEGIPRPFFRSAPARGKIAVFEVIG